MCCVPSCYCRNSWFYSVELHQLNRTDKRKRLPQQPLNTSGRQMERQDWTEDGARRRRQFLTADLRSVLKRLMYAVWNVDFRFLLCALWEMELWISSLLIHVYPGRFVWILQIMEPVRDWLNYSRWHWSLPCVSCCASSVCILSLTDIWSFMGNSCCLVHAAREKGWLNECGYFSHSNFWMNKCGQTWLWGSWVQIYSHFWHV